MPWITVTMMEGHTDAQKASLHQNVAKAVSESLDIPTEWVRIQLVEMKNVDHSVGGKPVT